MESGFEDFYYEMESMLCILIFSTQGVEACSAFARCRCFSGNKTTMHLKFVVRCTCVAMFSMLLGMSKSKYQLSLLDHIETTSIVAQITTLMKVTPLSGIELAEFADADVGADVGAAV